jgi:putative protease
MGDEMKKENEMIELLAPAGTPDAFYAAIRYGANAVYLGVESFNARMGAENILLADLPDYVEFAHLRNVKVYVAINTLIRDNEWPLLEETMEKIVDSGSDAVILQDLGVLTYMQEAYPSFECHASTQFSIYNEAGVRKAKELGFSRVVMARETSIDEIEKCAKIEGMELEVFVHGALCVSASGQCLLSSSRGGRSGNRGRCAQPCRLNYQSQEAHGLEAPWLSLKDLCGIEEIERLIQCGVHSLKIEGRSKRPAYVAGVVRSYREAIDGKRDVLPVRVEEMKSLYYRGFTKGLLNNASIKEIGSEGQPNHQGISVGHVKRYSNGKALIDSKHSFVSGDGIRYQDREGEWVGQNISWSESMGETLTLIRFQSKPRISGEVFLTKNHALEKSLDWNQNKIEPWLGINGQVVVEIGKKLQLVVSCQEKSWTFESEDAIEAARSRGSNKEEIEKQLNKMGGTPFYWNVLDISLPELAYVPARLVNELRRRMTEKVWNERLTREDSDVRVTLPDSKGNPAVNTMKYTAAIYGAKIGEQINPTLYDQIWILPELETEAWVAKARELGVAVGWTSLYGQILPETTQNLEQNDWNQTNLTFQSSGINLFPMNQWSIYRLQNLGLETIHLSPELSVDQIRTLSKGIEGDFEVMGYGRIPLMSMRHCPMKSMGICTGNLCDSCNRVYHLKDKEERSYPVARMGEFSYLLSHEPISNLAFLSELKRAGIRNLRFQFWDESDPIKTLEKWVEKSNVANREELNKWLDRQELPGDQSMIKWGVK